jgi:hypothetical protein
MWYIGECLAEPEPCHSRAGIDYSRKAPSMGEGLGRGEAAQFLSDRLVDAVDICQDFVIPKPQNAISLVLQEPTSPGATSGRVGRRRFPRSTEPPRTQSRAHKIGNVAADRYLAAELVPRHSVGAQYLPDRPLRLGHVLP